MKILCFVFVFLLCSIPSFGQQLAQGDGQAGAPNTYGTAGETAVTIPEQAFVPTDPTTTYAVATWKKWVTNNLGCCLEAPLTLPEGASIIGMQIEGCDTSASAEVDGVIVKCATPGGLCTLLSATPGSGIAATPGCGLFRADLSSAETVNNTANTYFIQVETTALTVQTSLRSVRVFYKLQVSPAPGTATFSDVPTSHPFFQYIEALAASGITGGCATPPLQYCPDAPVTRGQMAVFLSRALGLHWAP